MPIPTLAEKLAWLKPAPATQHEKDCAAKIPQGDYEIGVQITNDILDEAMEVFIRSSRSYFGVSGDSMVALFTAGGDLINASCGTYLHAIIQPIVIKFILKYFEKKSRHSRRRHLVHQRRALRRHPQSRSSRAHAHLL